MSDTTREPGGAETPPRLAVARFYHGIWLVARADRARAVADERVHAAHASRWHWGQVGTPANLARGEWQCARVYAALGLGEAALRHAERCLELVDAGGDGFEDWDRAAALEAVARARLAGGDTEEALRSSVDAPAAASQIGDPDDRAVIEADLAELTISFDTA
jgi:hypothetical protein